MMIPTLGRIVQYRLSDWDVRSVEAQRMSAVLAGAAGAGNQVRTGDVFPAMIVRVWGGSAESTCNLQVFLDGNDVLWVTSRAQGEGEGQWLAQPRVSPPEVQADMAALDAA